jgi:flagellar biosynthesis/type III secretory pathway protein FliH
MSADVASEQGRFAAREFLARWMRETGETPMLIVADRMLFAFEIGFQRGYTEGFRRAYEEAISKLQTQAGHG